MRQKLSTFIFICGPNGVGKSTVCKALHRKLAHSAWLESEWCRMINPFVLNEETIPLTIGNISGMLSSYLTCNWVDYVIFPYGFHGARQQIWTIVQKNLAEVPHRFIPITLTCSQQENTDRMKRDRRDAARIQRALAVRNLYDSLPYPTIDSTELSVDETADKVIAIVHESPKRESPFIIHI